MIRCHRSQGGNGGIEEIRYCTPFPQKFRVIANTEILHSPLTAGILKPRDHDRFGRAWHHCAAQNHCVRAVLATHGCSNFPDHSVDLSQVMLAVLEVRCTYAYERSVGGLHCFRDVCCGRQAACATRFRHNFVDTFFKDR
jgi:hypothetical protein